MVTAVRYIKEVTSNELGQLCEKTSRVWTCVIELL
jgi:hypothetical protein